MLATLGPSRVYAGFNLYLVVSGNRAAGNPENTYVTVINKPAGVTSSLPELARFCCGDHMWATDADFYTSVCLGLPANLPPGEYSVDVEIKNSRTQQTVKHSFTVLPTPPVTIPQRSPLGNLPSLTKYNEQMIAKGRAQLGNRETIIAGKTWDGNAWYYDGTRVAYQIADYTGDPTFAEYAKNPLDVYRPYVIENNGGIPGWRSFAQGLRMDFERTGNALSKQAVIALANASGSAKTADLIPESMSRELAYAISTLLEAEKLGQPRNARLKEYVDIALGHIDQWFVTEKYQRMAPFMFALTAEALIKYHAATGDARILPALKLGAEGIWAKAWVPSNRAFVYEIIPGAPPGAGAPDLNLLIVPVYGWIYSQTGDKSYIEKGDQIFSGGVEGAWLDQGKQFNQSYRWSMDYLKWRGAK